MSDASPLVGPLRFWRKLSFTTIFYFGFFFGTGMLILCIGNFPKTEFSQNIIPLTNFIYAFHLGCWMVLGMVANYLWDLFNAGKTFDDISLTKVLIPLLVSPIVFCAIWALVPKTQVEGHGLVAQIELTWSLVAFQNGFFWQVVFSKAQPNASSTATRA